MIIQRVNAASRKLFNFILMSQKPAPLNPKGEIFNKVSKRTRVLETTGKIVTGKVKEIISVAED